MPREDDWHAHVRVSAGSPQRNHRNPRRLHRPMVKAVNTSSAALGERVSISVVIPAYNSAAFLPDTLASVFAQSELPAEVIVIDDGSTDETAAVARSCGATVITVPNGGGAAARNIGTAAAVGEYIAYLDADDLWAPQKLAAQAAALASFAQPAFSFTDHHVFDERGIRTPRSELRSHPAFRRTVGKMRNEEIVVIAANDARPVLSDMYFLPSSALVRRIDVVAIGGWDESVRGGEDYEFFLRLFRQVPAVAVMQPLLLYRRHPAQVTASQVARIDQEFKIRSCVVAAPERYPRADATFSLNKDGLLYYRLGCIEARLGKFDEAIVSLRKSMAARRTLRAGAMFVAVRCARSRIGRTAFETLRTIRRKLRRERRSAGPVWFRNLNGGDHS